MDDASVVVSKLVHSCRNKGLYVKTTVTPVKSSLHHLKDTSISGAGDYLCQMLWGNDTCGA